MRRSTVVLALLTAAGPVATGRAIAATEVFEEIVAKVDDDVITKTDLAEAEQEALADLYRRFAGKELDEKRLDEVCPPERYLERLAPDFDRLAALT